MSYYTYDRGYQGFGADLPEEQKQLSRAIAAKVTGKTSGKAFDAAVKFADFGFTQAMLAAEYVGQTQAGKAISAGGSAGAIAYSLISNAQAGRFKPDAAGVVAVASHVDKFLNAVASFAGAVGANPRAVKSIQNWSAVGMTCAIGGTAAATSAGVGAIAGGAACALAVINGILSEAFGAQPEFSYAADVPRSVLQLNGDNKALVATDALRLSKVLRHHYGLSNFLALYNGLTINRFDWINERTYPPRPARVDDTPDSRLMAPDRPIPAHNMATILQMLSAASLGMDPARADRNVRDGLAILSAYRTGVEPAGRGLFRRFYDDNDINVESVATGAYLGRAAAATSGSAKVNATVTVGGNQEGWNFKEHSYQYAYPFFAVDVPGVNMLPFVQLDELINFFAATTVAEMFQYGGSAIDGYRIGALNPVRMVTVADRSSTHGEPEKLQGGKGYSSICWTNLRSVVGADDSRWCNRLMPKAQGGDIAALREVGAIRLMAAFSYLHMMWKWSNDNIARREDPLTISEPRDEVFSPIDPRQLLPNGSRLSLRVDDSGRILDSAKTTIGQIRGLVAPGNGNFVVIKNASGSGFGVARAPTMRSPDVYVDSNVSVRYVSDMLNAHNKLAEDTINAVAKQVPSPRVTMAQLFLNPTVQRAIETSSKSASELFLSLSPQTRLFAMEEIKRQQGAGGAVMIGAAALAALLLLR